MNLARQLLEQAARRPEQPALITGSGAEERSISFAELERRTAQGAALLASRAVGAGDRVLLLVPMSIEFYEVLIATLRLGAVPTIIDPAFGLRRFDACCRALRPQAVIASGLAQGLRLLLGGVRRIPLHVTVGRRWLPALAWSTGEGISERQEIVSREPDDPAIITSTSGSTGIPKIALRSHGLLDAQRRALAEALQPEAGSADLATLPLFVLANLASGVTSVIAAADLRRPGAIDAGPVLEQVRRHRPRSTVASPAFLARLVEGAGRGDLDSLRRVDTGGAPIFRHDLERFARAAPNARVVALYGSTEAEPIAEIAFDELTEEDHAATARGEGLLAGRPVPSVRLRVIDDRWGTPLGSLDPAAFDALTRPPGAVGEIVVSGPHVLPGYLDGIGDEETKFRVDGVPWHRTGDTGHFDAHGRLWLTGRAAARTVDGEGTLYPLQAEAAAHLAAEGLGISLRRAALVSGTRTLFVEAPEAGEVEAALLAALRAIGVRRVIRTARIPVDRRHNAKIDYPALAALARAHRVS